MDPLATRKYPEAVIIDGVSHTVKNTPELQQFFDTIVSVASQTEKGKLYGEIDKLKLSKTELEQKVTTVSTQLQGSLTTSQKQLQDYETARTEISDLRSKNVTNSSDLALAIESAFKMHVPPLLQMYLEPINELTSKMKSDGLRSYREQRIHDAGLNIFPELVKGTTPEEIDASLAQSITLYKTHVLDKQVVPIPTAPVIPAATVPGQLPMGYAVVDGKLVEVAPAPAPVYLPVVGSMPNPAASTMPDIKSMSAEEFDNQREQLFAAVSSAADAYSKQSGQ